jgi:hypothetical protein
VRRGAHEVAPSVEFAWDAGNVKWQRAAIPIRGGVAVVVLHGSSARNPARVAFYSY